MKPSITIEEIVIELETGNIGNLIKKVDAPGVSPGGIHGVIIQCHNGQRFMLTVQQLSDTEGYIKSN